MLRHNKPRNINRIIDANINRVKEGLRVCEEIARFILDDRALTADFKKIRHAIDTIKIPIKKSVLIEERNPKKDVGRNIYVNELKRKGYQDIFFANIQRAKESIRVLEEFNKLINIETAINFKKVRYRIYEIEQKTAKKITASK